MNKPIAISRLHFPVTSLGPGRRIGIWFQGCSIHCPGCISRDTWETDQGWITVEILLAAIQPWIDKAEGITISGGEPFDQPEALRELLQGLRRMTATDVLVYSGYTFSEIESLVNESPSLIDVLISEPYLERATQTSPLRGSDNQVMHFLTELGRRRFESFDRKIQSGDRRFDIMFDDDGSAWIAGVPLRDDFRRFKRSLQAAGHVGQFSDSPMTEVSS